jgi:hypothetical protein
MKGGFAAGGVARLGSRIRRRLAIAGIDAAALSTGAREKTGRQQRMGRRCSACWIENNLQKGSWAFHRRARQFQK